MEQVIKLVKTYRLSSGLAERLRLAEAIFHLIEPDLRVFVFSAIVPHAAKDVSQEVLISIANSLNNFKGGSKEEFLKWCYKIARRRIYDHIRKKASDRLQHMPHDELLDSVDASARLRSWAKKHPVSDKSLESVKNTVREQWEQEQVNQRPSKPAPAPAKAKSRKREEPDRD